jgi:hypothetical protein
MAFKPNYRFERAERDRLKKAKKEEKLRRQRERASSPRDDSSTGREKEEDLPEG